LVFQNATRGAAIQALGLNPPEKVAMIYAYNQEFGAVAPQETYSVDQAGNAEQLWQIMKRSTEFGRWMGRYGSSTPADTVQLQAADLFAYELLKEFENQITRPKDRMRWGLREILKLVNFPFHFIHLFDRKELLRIIKESSWPDQTGTEEVGDPAIQMMSANRQIMRRVKDRLDDESNQD
jgi:hypothetical protein